MSGGYGEPDWATPGATGPVTTQTATTGGAIAAPVVDGSKRDKGILVMLSLAGFGIATLMAATGILALLDFSGTSGGDYTEVFLSTYMIIFAVLLFLYELMWWQGIPPINRIMRKNFGFLYGVRGKGFYMIFIAFLTLGLRNTSLNQVLLWATGISFLALGTFHVVLTFVKPDLVLAYKPPTSGLTTSMTDEGETGSAPV